MTVLPLVGRELRVRARSPAGYWTRFAAALAGMLVCVPILTMYRGAMLNQAQLGVAAFDGLVVAAFILCCFCGFLTVDGISRERREGTLGLLFLTRVRALDVLLGNFGAAGIASLCALAAFVPVLIVPVLAGGVSGGEAVRKVLALFDTMLLSLAAGLWASARGREWLSSAQSAALVLVVVIFVPALLGLLIPLGFRLPHGWLPGPLSALSAAGDVAYRKSPAPYWISIGVVHAISWLLMISAGSRLRRAWRREEDGPPRLRIKFVKRAPLKKTEAPLQWLMRGQRGIKGVVWAGAFVRAFSFLVTWVFIVFIRVGAYPYFSWGVGLAASLVGNCFFAWAASRFFVEARRSGEFELLMTTPEGARTMVASQWKWLKEVFFWPTVLLAVPWTVVMNFGFSRSYPSFYVFWQLFSVANTLGGVVALIWTGMWFGWSERSQARAVVRIVLAAAGAPYLLGTLVSWPLQLFYSPMRSFAPSNAQYLLLLQLIPQMIKLAYFFWLIRWAKHKLKT